ncbi:hypothetical protein PROFUN_13563 [Planoprotostelium fungivorum]|uniref:Uncharacterized protein n=1 Tax=Planoprotostelium fungivorum TaxID=1890364 RepID=A0A2P6N3E8_9EUKA|nr:hypothetical protein PROFUN_13563 [Planoprotostelium fungivorum]
MLRRYSVKLELNCTLVNIEDGTTIEKTYLFPADHAIKISSIKHISDLNNTLQLWIQNSFAADDAVPDTKHRVHEFIAFKLKLAKSQQGGCKGYTVDLGLKNKRCLKNPDLKDNLCFWRSIAIALEKAIDLRDQYFAQCGQIILDHVQVADLPVICQSLNLDLTVYTLDDNLNSLKLYESGYRKTNWWRRISELPWAPHVGSSILSWSKVLMLDFVYNCLYQHYDKTEVDLLYTDTDSIYMQAKVSSYEEFKQRFPDHLQKLHFAAAGDITPGKMKLECELKEAVFVKPKTYSYVKKDGKEDVRNKGVVLSQNKEILIFDSYKRAIFSDDLIMVKNTLIRKTIHNDALSMNTMTVDKAALDGWYDKRIMIDNIHTVPFGLYSKQFSEEDVMNRIMKNLAARVNIGLGQLKTYLLCTQNQLKTHLASQFHSGMSQMNYGVLWNLDHCVPVSFARDNLKALCHYSNIQPMLVTENSSKCADLGLPKGM